jgi:hypothetical protein
MVERPTRRQIERERRNESVNRWINESMNALWCSVQIKLGPNLVLWQTRLVLSEAVPRRCLRLALKVNLFLQKMDDVWWFSIEPVEAPRSPRIHIIHLYIYNYIYIYWKLYCNIVPSWLVFCAQGIAKLCCSTSSTSTYMEHKHLLCYCKRFADVVWLPSAFAEHGRCRLPGQKNASCSATQTPLPQSLPPRLWAFFLGFLGPEKA